MGGNEKAAIESLRDFIRKIRCDAAQSHKEYSESG